MTIHNVTTAAELTTALNAAVGGDRIELAPGAYGPVDINAAFASDVTIISADPNNPARLTEVDMEGASHIVLDSLRIGGGASDINGSSFITIRNSVFAGKPEGVLGTAKGLVFRNGEHLAVEYNEFFGWWKALKFHTATDVIVRNNNIHRSNNDAINFTGANGVLVEGNWIHDFFTDPNQGHNDMIQFWVTDPSHVSENIIIRGNFFDAGTGRSVQTIFMRNGLAEQNPNDLSLYYKNVLVKDNVIYNGHLHGITVGESIGLTIINNTLLRDAFVSSGTTNAPQIRGSTFSQQVTIDANIGHKAAGTNFFKVQDTDPNAANYYGNLFVNALGPDPGLADLRAIAGGTIETLGVGAAMTRADIPLNVGPGAGTTPPPPQNQAPTADFSVSTTDLVASFADLSSDPDGTVAAWDWDFGDGATSTDQDPEHIYTAGGSYQVTLTVTDNDGATATAVQPVTVTEPAPPPPPPPPPGTGPVFQAGPHVFDGTLGAAQIFPHDPAYEVADGTIEVAFTVDGLVARQAIFSKDASGNASGGHFNLYLEQGKLIARIQDAANSYTVAKIAGVVGGQSHHVAVTFGAGGLSLWLDGVVVDADPYSGGLSPSTEFIVIGANNWASTSGTTNNLREPMTGSVERASLYDRVLSAEEIQSLSSSGALPQPMTLEEQVYTLVARLDAMEARLTRLGG